MALIVNRLMSSLRRKLKLRHSLSELDPDLAAKELFFKAPGLTPELVAAIKLISPQFHLRADEPSRRFWELNQNGVCWGEFEVLEPFLRNLEAPSKVLDIGPGLGRSAIFFKNAMQWQKVPFHLYEGSGKSTRYTRAGPRFDDSFCGNLEVLENLLRFNETDNYKIFDAADMGGQLTDLPGPYDFVYSFFAIGWHWSIEHFLDEILRLMNDRAIGAFSLHPRFEDYHLFDDLPHKIVDFRRSWPRGRQSEMLILARTEEALHAG